MDNNASLIALVIFALILVACAVALTLTAEPPPPPEPEVPPINIPVNLEPTVERSGGIDPVFEGPVEVKRKRKEKARAATLQCAGWKGQRTFGKEGKEKNLAKFPNVPLDQECELLIDGASRPYAPVYAGDQLEKCFNDNGMTSCEGGIAADQPAKLTITADGPATLELDGQDLGELPITDHPVPLGARVLKLGLPNGRTGQAAVTVKPDETVVLTFQLPAD